MQFLKHSKNLTKGRRITVGAIYDQDTHTFSFGLAVCKPGEPFSKAEARNKALGRAVSQHPANTIQVPSADRGERQLRDLFHRTADILMNNKDTEIELRLAAGTHGGKLVKMY